MYSYSVCPGRSSLSEANRRRSVMSIGELSWEIARRGFLYDVHFGGKTEEWTDQDDNHGNRKIDLVADDDRSGNPTHEIQLKDIRGVIADQLSDKERIIVTLYYYEGLTLAEIGDVLGVTESRVCQIHTKSVLHLRGRLTEPPGG